jgi:hypothetical protein
MTTNFSTIHTRIEPTQDSVVNERRMLARLEDLQGHGRFGYRLLSTVTVKSIDAETIIDTLAKENE